MQRVVVKQLVKMCFLYLVKKLVTLFKVSHILPLVWPLYSPRNSVTFFSRGTSTQVLKIRRVRGKRLRYGSVGDCTGTSGGFKLLIVIRPSV